MLSGMRLGPGPSKVSCELGSEVFHPAAYSLVGDHNPAFSQQVLDIAKAESEPGIEPDGMLDDHRREAISGVANLGHDKGLRPQITAGKPNNVTMTCCLRLTERGPYRLPTTKGGTQFSSPSSSDCGAPSAAGPSRTCHRLKTNSRTSASKRSGSLLLALKMPAFISSFARPRCD